MIDGNTNEDAEPTADDSADSSIDEVDAATKEASERYEVEQGAAEAGAVYIETTARISFDKGRIGMTFDDHDISLIKFVHENTQAAVKGVQVGMRVTHIAGRKFAEIDGISTLKELTTKIKYSPRPLVMDFVSKTKTEKSSESTPQLDPGGDNDSWEQEWQETTDIDYGFDASGVPGEEDIDIDDYDDAGDNGSGDDDDDDDAGKGTCEGSSCADKPSHPCPATHPYAYRPKLNFDYCCSTGRDYAGNPTANSHPDLSKRSDSCANNGFTECPNPPCVDAILVPADVP
jgi:hypothetical protein